ncbi:uncharacterized protein ISCGN_022744 [Ixodes scapularis]
MLATFRSGCFQDAYKGHGTSAAETRGDPYAILTDGNSSKCNIIAEVPSSNAMEKVAFLRGLAKLKDQGFTIASFMSDRHPGVECHMRTMESGTKHYFDTWHISKGVKKKLLAASRSGPCKDLEVWVQPVNNHLYHSAALGEGNGPLMVSMWMSLLNHVVNKHDGHDGPYHECLHQPLSGRAWLAVGTPAYEKLRSIVASPRLLKDIQHLSPGTQTYCVEAFNSLLLGFASKSRVFSPEGMEASTDATIVPRLCLARLEALHLADAAIVPRHRLARDDLDPGACPSGAHRFASACAPFLAHVWPPATI